MQVVVVGAGRADLVTQHGTRLDPGGIATRSGQSRLHRGSALSKGCVLMAQDEGRGEAIPQQAVLRRPSLLVFCRLRCLAATNAVRHGTRFSTSA